MNVWEEGGQEYADWLLTPETPEQVRAGIAHDLAMIRDANRPVHVEIDVDAQGRVLQGHMRAQVIGEEHRKVWHGERE